MHKYILVVLAILIMASFAGAHDLYKISVASEAEAEWLRSLDLKPVLRMHDGYLVLVDPSDGAILQSRVKTAALAATDIDIEQLAIDRRRDGDNAEKYPLVYEQDNLRIFRVDWSELTGTKQAGELLPIFDKDLRIEYHRPKIYNTDFTPTRIDLDSLIGLVSQDSLESYLHRLEDFQTRLTGTDSSYAARDWIAAKFASFGYDSVVIDPFIGSQLWDRVPVQSYNVIATKVGSRFPDLQIIVGGHFDAVPDCPGADDNGTGTVATLEMARILKDIETEMTFIFIAFDSEESWLWGSYDYADSVAALDANILYMQNLDMIGHLPNTNRANLYNGPEMAYSMLWNELADSLVGITATFAGSTASDHYPFQEHGYAVTFVQEYLFSSHYHQPSDSTTYINFEYMTRMVKASLATVYVSNYALMPIELVSVLDVGDGQSLEITWEPGEPGQIDHYMLYYDTVAHSSAHAVYLPKDSSRYIIAGLTEGEKYFFHIIAYDDLGNMSIAYDELSGIPYEFPQAPDQVVARPLVNGIRLDWHGNNKELDFDHYQVIRDDLLLPDFVYDTTFADMDPGLGSDFHDYWVAAVDIDGNVSDTSGIAPVISRAATLRPGRILAINRSASNSSAMVDEAVTGEFMREALDGLSYEYFSDTSAANPKRAGLLDMIDYALIVIGAESGRQDDIGNDPAFGGILDEIGYYLSIGGKAVIFGRWGDISVNDSTVDMVVYHSGDYNGGYHDYFDIHVRKIPRSFINPADGMIKSDFIGADSHDPAYPDLVWDSMATINHWPVLSKQTGVPCVAFDMITANADPFYGYNSLNDSILTEGQVVAWRHIGGPYEYVFFEIPLSFMERSAAVAALRQAVGDMGIISDVDDYAGNTPLPKSFELSQNYPNPFNPNTVMRFYNPEPRRVEMTLEVFNILGQKVRVLYDDAANPGWNRGEWDGCDESGHSVASGIYFYRLRAEDFSYTRKMVLLR